MLVRIVVDELCEGNFKIITCFEKDEERSYSKKNVDTILQDWKLLKNLVLPKEKECSKTRVVGVRIDAIPVSMKVEDLSKVISYGIMENCLKKMEQPSLTREDKNFWMGFVERTRHLNMIENLFTVGLSGENDSSILLLDPTLNLSSNVRTSHKFDKDFNDLNEFTIILTYQSTYVRPV